MAFYIAIYTKRSVAKSIIFMFLISTVVAKRGSRAVFGNMFRLLKLKQRITGFFIVHSFSVYQKYLSLLLTNLS